MLCDMYYVYVVWYGTSMVYNMVRVWCMIWYEYDVWYGRSMVYDMVRVWCMIWYVYVVWYGMSMMSIVYGMSMMYDMVGVWCMIWYEYDEYSIWYEYDVWYGRSMVYDMVWVWCMIRFLMHVAVYYLTAKHSRSLHDGLHCKRTKSNSPKNNTNWNKVIQEHMLSTSIFIWTKYKICVFLIE